MTINIYNLPDEVNEVFEDMSEEKSKQILETNVYELIPYDVPFRVVDELAFKLGGYTEIDTRRLTGAIATVVYDFMRSGSTTWRLSRRLDDFGVLQGYKNGIRENLSELLYKQEYLFPVKHHMDWVVDKLGFKLPRIKSELFNLALQFAETTFHENGRLVFELIEYKGRVRFIYKPIYWSEIHIANRLISIMNSKSLITKQERKDMISGLDKRLNEEQYNACVSSINNKVTFITGGAGVGKTFVIESLVKTIIENTTNVNLRVVAPTGRASLNIQEALLEQGSEQVVNYMQEYEASTIHRLLKLRASKFKGGARSKFHFKHNPLDCNFVIIDEASMVDTILMNNLLWALPNDAHIVIVGDPNQLASVGAGQVLYDLTVVLNHGKQFRDVNINRPNWVTLKEVQRTSAEANLPYLSDSLLNADKTKRWEDFERELDIAINKGSVEFIDTRNILESTKNIYLSNEDSIIITPRHEGKDGGRIDINNSIMTELGFIGYQIGVPVVQNKNNYDKGVLNGERGIISAVNHKDERISVAFEGGQVLGYELNEIQDELIIAYATTVHKSQGSEADVVVLPIWTKNKKSVWDISLLYTALTRAKKKVYIVGSRNDLKLSMNRSRNNHRFTMLPHRYRAKFK